MFICAVGFWRYLLSDKALNSSCASHFKQFIICLLWERKGEEYSHQQKYDEGKSLSGLSKQGFNLFNSRIYLLSVPTLSFSFLETLCFHESNRNYCYYRVLFLPPAVVLSTETVSYQNIFFQQNRYIHSILWHLPVIPV